MNKTRPFHFHPAQVVGRRPHMAALLDPEPVRPGASPRAVRCIPCAVAAVRSRRDKTPILEAP